MEISPPPQQYVRTKQTIPPCNLLNKHTSNSFWGFTLLWYIQHWVPRTNSFQYATSSSVNSNGSVALFSTISWGSPFNLCLPCSGVSMARGSLSGSCCLKGVFTTEGLTDAGDDLEAGEEALEEEDFLFRGELWILFCLFWAALVFLIRQYCLLWT